MNESATKRAEGSQTEIWSNEEWLVTTDHCHIPGQPYQSDITLWRKHGDTSTSDATVESVIYIPNGLDATEIINRVQQLLTTRSDIEVIFASIEAELKQKRA
jgi:hypothetical protein